jgi:hypothetical protein
VAVLFAGHDYLLPSVPAPSVGGTDSSVRDMSDQASAQGTGGSGGGSGVASGMASSGVQEQQVRVNSWYNIIADNALHVAHA